MTLLEKALQTKTLTKKEQYGVTNEVVRERAQLAIAFFNGHISGAQAAEAINRPAGQISGRMGDYIAAGITRGIVKVEMIPEKTATA